jgi:DNA methyltransferase 1-associated protein 1
MGDVAQILGIHNNNNNNNNASNTQKEGNVPSTSHTARANVKAHSNVPPPAPSSHTIPLSIQNTSTILSKPVLKIISGQQESKNATSSTLPPIVPSHNLPLQTVKRRIDSISNNNNNGINSSNNKSSTPPPPSSNNITSQHSYVKINNKAISTKRARSWIYAPFSNNSARNDRLTLHHWVRAGVEYPDYPYARFDVHLEALSYRNEAIEIENANKSRNANSNAAGLNETKNTTATSAASGRTTGAGNAGASTGDANASANSNSTSKSEEEINAIADLFYERYLHNDKWSQCETDTLLELCRVYELRWPVIIDRWIGKFGSFTSKKVEDLQHRYYSIGYVLNRMKVERVAKVEAENLAKAMAAANQSVAPSASVIGSALPTAATALNVLNNNDVKANEALQAEHALASAIVSSSSNAINSVVGDVKTNLQPPIPVPNTGTSNQPTFDLESERQRRKVLDTIWARTKEEELEEIELRNELKLVEMQIKRMKKSGGHILAAATAASTTSTAGTGNAPTGSGTALNASVSASASIVNGAATGTSSRGQSPIPAGADTSIQNGTDSSYNIINAQFSKNVPKPTAGTPYLQSGRQKQPTTGGQMGINKTTIKRMDQILQEFKITEQPIPTKRVCDLYDHVRKGALMLLTLQKVMLKKESEVVSCRLRLEKMAGTVVQQREAAAASAAAAAAAAASQAAAAAAAANAEKAATNTANAKSGKGSSGTGSKSASASTSGSKKSTSKGTSSGKSGTKEKKTKKKASGEGGTKKRKSTSKKKTSTDDSSKASTSKASTSKESSSKGSSSKGSSSKGSSSKGSSSKKGSSKTGSTKTGSTKGGGSKTSSSKAGGVKTAGAKAAGAKTAGAKVAGAKAAGAKATGVNTSSTMASSKSPNTSIKSTSSTTGSATTSNTKGNNSDGKPAKKRVKKS